MAGVLVGEDCGGGVETPVDGERGVYDRDAAVGLRMVVVVTPERELPYDGFSSLRRIDLSRGGRLLAYLPLL